MKTLTLCLLQNLLSFQSKFLLRSKVGFVPVGFVPFSLDNFLDLLQVAHKFIYKESHFKIIFQATKAWGRDLLCSSSRPQSFILLASCWAFFFSLQAREASLFFSLRDLVLLWKKNIISFNIICIDTWICLLRHYQWYEWMKQMKLHRQICWFCGKWIVVSQLFGH